jgi:hypothetical protein
MRQITHVLAVVGVAIVAACGGGDSPATSGSMTQGSTAPTATTGPAASTAADGASCPDGFTTVSGQANIFGAGTDSAPDPGGGGGGVVPPSWRLPEGSSVVRFPTVTGKVTSLLGLVDYFGPAGDVRGATNIESYGGISGIIDRRSGMFLVGVFLTDDPPSTPAPKRLDFTKGERFQMLAPRVGQTFFIGDGRGRTFRVPPATRLFLGFADAYSDQKFYQGHPGYYENNSGHLCIEVEAAKQ